MKKTLYPVSMLAIGFCFFLLLPCTTTQAEEIDIVNRPVNTSGLTGLLFTTAPYTLPRGTVEVAASILNESSDIPKFTITEFPASVTIGLPKNSEVALRWFYYNIKEGPTGTAGTTRSERKTGDVELAYKWDFLPQPEDSIRPALALIIAGMLPTEDNSDMKINAVTHWGMRLGLSTGTEISWKDHMLGMYADAQVIGHDPTEQSIRNIYEVYNAGLLFPISKYQNLQMFIEYTIVNGKKNIAVDGGDYSGFTSGIRLVSERFNLTIGTQFIRKQAKDFDNSERLIGLVSMKF